MAFLFILLFASLTFALLHKAITWQCVFFCVGGRRYGSVTMPLL